MSAVSQHADQQPSETRPDRALYNVGVTLRMVDQLLTDLSEGAHRASPSLSELADRVRSALHLVDRLPEEEHHAHAASLNGVGEKLKSELTSLLAELQDPTPEV